VYPGLNDTAMAKGGVDAYGGKPPTLMKLMPLGQPAIFASRIADAVEKKRRRVIYPRVYWIVRWFPRISQWISTRFAPRLPARVA
jgi:hypothetical protein